MHFVAPHCLVTLQHTLICNLTYYLPIVLPHCLAPVVVPVAPAVSSSSLTC